MDVILSTIIQIFIEISPFFSRRFFVAVVSTPNVVVVSERRVRPTHLANIRGRTLHLLVISTTGDK